MLELRLVPGGLLMKVLEAIKDLLEETTFDCSDNGLSLHTTVVSLELRSSSFEHYRCDENMSLGMNLRSTFEMLKCAVNDDIVTLKADSGGDSVTFTFESLSHDKISEFKVNLMNIYGAINLVRKSDLDTEYDATVRMPSTEFMRICRDLSIIGDYVFISITEEEVTFRTWGAIGRAKIVYPANNADSEEAVAVVHFNKRVSHAFNLERLNLFTKATALSSTVTLSMIKITGSPILVEYNLPEIGYIRYYLGASPRYR